MAYSESKGVTMADLSASMTYLGGISCHPDFQREQLKGKIGEEYYAALKKVAENAAASGVNDPNELQNRLLATRDEFLNTNGNQGT